MKLLKSLFAIVLITVVLFGLSSCIVLYPNGNTGKRGWHKNTNNPHNPNTTNPGNSEKNKGRGHK